jgi:hypothetical protein
VGWEIELAGAAGIGLICGGAIAIWGRFKKRRRAIDGDEAAKAALEKSRTLELVVAPLCIIAGICLLAFKTYSDYERLRQPLPPDKALERAMKNFPKSN